MEFRGNDVLPLFLESYCFAVQEDRSVCLWGENLEWEDKSSEYHEDPNCPSPTDILNDISSDDGTENRSDKRTNKES